MSDESGGGDQPIVIKKIVKGGGHHGGAWKVAYADFVTAMMAFFLLMWLLNVTDAEQKNAISNYFDPTHPKVSQNTSGAGGVMGGTAMSTEGSMTTTVQDITQPTPTGTSGSSLNAAKASGLTKGNETTEFSGELNVSDSAQADAEAEIQQAEEEKLEEIKDAIEEAMENNPELADLSENLLVDMTEEGLRIQVVDSEGKPMFPSGSSRMFPRTQKLMEQVGKIIKGVPNEISIRGHTDSVPYGANADYTNWELSSDRANASRRALKDTGISSDRLNNVVGKADTEHLLPEDPTNARNRRISIVLLREELTDPEAYKKRVDALAKEKRAKMKSEQPTLPGAVPDQMKPVDPNAVPSIPEPESSPFKKTDGNVQFP